MNLHDFIRAQRVRIIGRWENRIGERPVPLTDASRAVMDGVLEAVLFALAVRTLPPQMDGDLIRHPPSDDSESPVEDAVHDFGALCDAIMQTATEDGLEFSPTDIEVLNIVLDEAIAKSLGRVFRQSRQIHERIATERREILAHELRNALSGARYALQALEHEGVGSGSGSPTRAADVLKRSLARMGALIEHEFLKTYGRHRAPLQVRRINLGELLRNVTSAAATSRGITLRLDGDADSSMEIDGDEAMLASALSNLLSNALKFTRDGGEVCVRVDRDQSRTKIEVEDECGGLPAPVDILLQPYVQRSRDRSGVGLGLTVAHDVVLAHHGVLSARDVPGKGCVFVVSLPVAAEP